MAGDVAGTKWLLCVPRCDKKDQPGTFHYGFVPGCPDFAKGFCLFGDDQQSPQRSDFVVGQRSEVRIV